MRIVLCILLFVFAHNAKAQISDFEHIDFKKADRIAIECPIKTLDNLPKLVKALTSNLTTDVERFRAIYMWVTANIANDYKLYNKNMHKRRRFKDNSVKLESWNERFNKIIFDMLIEDKKTICTGYAYIIRELTKLIDLDCRIVNGYGKASTTIDQLDTPNHSWNVVKLNEKWYFCDATWASGIPNPETNFFKFNFNPGYFLSDPKLFALNHYPIDEKWLLLDDVNYTYEAFIETPLLYNNAYKNLVQHVAPEKMHQTVVKNESVRFKYLIKTTDLNKEDIHFLIDDGYDAIRKKPLIVSINGNELIIEHTFKNRGFYDVHLYFKEELIATYTFKVKAEL